MSEVLVEGIRKTLGGMLTLQDINMKIGERELVGILGPSGCGKTTLFHIIAGLMKPDRGRICIDSDDVTGQTGIVSYMQQKDLLLPFLNILDNVSIPLVLKGASRREARARARENLDTFGLKGFENYYPSQLSGGMRQRAAMLRTYLFSTGVWLLDEPFASLDAITKRKMHSWMIGVLNRLHPTVLFITHDVDEALQLCDRVYVLSECPTVVKLDITVPCPRPEIARTITDPEYGRVRDTILDALAV